MALASAAIQSARRLLNDTNGITWSDALLFPLLQEAHGELLQELEINNSAILHFRTDPITIRATQTTLGSYQPTTMSAPIKMMEGNVGTNPSCFSDMERVTFLPYVDKDSVLHYWTWSNELIQFVGATCDRDVVLWYEGMIGTPSKQTDQLGVLFAERYLGPRIAALAYATIGRENQFFSDAAQKALYKIIQSQVLNDQRPVRRRGYRSPKGIALGPHSVPVGGTTTNIVSGDGVTWIDPAETPDGIITVFTFTSRPKFASWGGAIYFQTSGYTLTPSGGVYQITFIGPDSTPLAPAPGDVVKAAI